MALPKMMMLILKAFPQGENHPNYFFNLATGNQLEFIEYALQHKATEIMWPGISDSWRLRECVADMTDDLHLTLFMEVRESWSAEELIAAGWEKKEIKRSKPVEENPKIENVVVEFMRQRRRKRNRNRRSGEK